MAEDPVVGGVRLGSVGRVAAVPDEADPGDGSRGGGRERPHDDLVLALALACRQAESEWLRDEWIDYDCSPQAFDLGFLLRGYRY